MDYFTSDRFELPNKGDLLISEPYLPDPNFERTVVYLCEHDENGTFGFVLNRKSNIFLDDIMDEVSGFKSDVYVGGPVQKDTLHFIHREPRLAEKSQLINDEIRWGGDFDQMLTLINTKTLDQGNIKFFVGYSGWAPKQLEAELKEKSWIIFRGATHEMVFDWDNQDLWKACLSAKGGKYKLISNYPKDPRMN